MAEILQLVTGGKTLEVRLNVPNALGKYGVHARAAVPTIVGSVTDSDGGIRTEARRALVKINLAALIEVQSSNCSTPNTGSNDLPDPPPEGPEWIDAFPRWSGRS
jgi:hypothetical protein